MFGTPHFFFLIRVRAYNVMSGLFQAPYYAYSQTIMAELSPPGFDNMVSTLSGVLLHAILTRSSCIYSFSAYLVFRTALRP